MINTNKELLRGTWAALLLPIRPDESIDYGCMQAELDFLCESGVNGIYSNGTAGEFFNQTESEFDKISGMIAHKCQKSNMPFQIGASHSSPIVSLERMKRTKSLRPEAFQIIMPDWVATNQEEQILFLKRMAEVAAPIPLVLYCPGHAKNKFLPADLKRLSDAIPELRGVKVAASNSDWYREMRPISEQLAVFVPGHRLATGIREEVAAGSYSNVACLNPFAAQRWYKQMGEDLSAALEIESRILDFFQRCILPYSLAGYSDMALDKFLAAVGGWCNVSTRLRWPYIGIGEGRIAQARQLGHNLLPEFFKL